MTVVSLENEAREQREFVKWLRLKNILFYHIPNGGKRDKRLVRDKNGNYRWVCLEGAELKRQGLQAGVPDICIPVARKGFHGLYIELKTSKGVVSSEQESWIESLTRQDYMAIVARPDCHAAIKIVEDYFG